MVVDLNNDILAVQKFKETFVFSEKERKMFAKFGKSDTVSA